MKSVRTLLFKSEKSSMTSLQLQSRLVKVISQGESPFMLLFVCFIKIECSRLSGQKLFNSS